jgi:hypothetical protein
MRMGVDTPVPVTSPSEGKESASVQYRTVGTNIDCQAWDAGEGRNRLSLSVESSSAIAARADAPGNAPPLFRRFDTTLDPVLRDGQSLQTVASTDPVTGEVVKIDVTLNVIR